VPDCWFCCAFFLFIHYPHATYLDHGEDMYSPFPVRCFFFLFIQYSYATYLDHDEGPLGSICTVRFLAAVHV